MKGLIFNLLADLASRAGCEEEAWDVALLTAGELSCERPIFQMEGPSFEVLPRSAEEPEQPPRIKEPIQLLLFPDETDEIRRNRGPFS